MKNEFEKLKVNLFLRAYKRERARESERERERAREREGGRERYIYKTRDILIQIRM